MVAGARPEVAEQGPDRGRIRIEPERFDAALRDRFMDFFQRPFAEAPEARFPSAEEMRGEWIALFAQPSHEPSRERRVRHDVLATATAETLVEALPLSARARNALDRAGVVKVADLLQLPRNHLSAIRGVGHKVAREIVEVAERLRERLTISAAPPLVADFPGPRLWLDVDEMGLGTETRDRLLEAGITNTAELARSPDERIQRLLGAGEVKRLRALLHDLAAAQPVSGTLAQWARDLLAPKQRRTVAERRVRVLVGADPMPGDAADEAQPGARRVQQVARALGVDPAKVHSSLQVMRRKWSGVACREELNAALREVIEDLGQLCTLEEAARELARRQ